MLLYNRSDPNENTAFWKTVLRLRGGPFQWPLQINWCLSRLTVLTLTLFSMPKFRGWHTLETNACRLRMLSSRGLALNIYVSLPSCASSLLRILTGSAVSSSSDRLFSSDYIICGLRICCVLVWLHYFLRGLLLETVWSIFNTLFKI